MKKVMLIIALVVISATATIAKDEVAVASEIEEDIAEETVTLTNVEDTTAAECFVDDDGDGVCDTCDVALEDCPGKPTDGECTGGGCCSDK